MKRVLWILFCILATTTICTAQSVLYFPQIAEGVQAGGFGWGIVIAITNPAAPGTAVASGALALTKDDGTPFTMTLKNGNSSITGDTFPFQLGGGQITIFLSAGESGQSSAPLATGFATVSSNLPVAGGVIFSEQGFRGRIAEAGVGAATPLTAQMIIALAPSPTNPDSPASAVALANPGTGTANITFQLLDPNGGTAAPAVTRTLAANHHTAFFASQLFPNVTIGGTLQILSDLPLAATALLFENNGQFATIPVFPLP
jgi:hypothetical protein